VPGIQGGRTVSVYKRGEKGVFYMNFTVNGVRVFKSTQKFTKKEAKQVEANERQKMLNEATMTPQEKAAKVLLSEAVEQVFEGKWKNNKDAKGSYGRGLKLVEWIGDIPIGQINEDVVNKLVKGFGVRKSYTSTCNRYLAILKTILRFKRLQWDYIKMGKERKGRIRVFSREEERRAIELLKNSNHSERRYFYPEVGDLVEVLVDTGMRLSEALNLRYEDINYTTNLLTIWFNKGDRPRSIPMTKKVLNVFKRRHDRNPVKPFSISKDQSDGAWRWVRSEMGLKDDREFVLHALRHTCASRLVNKGIDLYVVKEWLGHSSIQVTEKYAHLSPKKLAHAASVLEPEDDE
jgi:integrase